MSFVFSKSQYNFVRVQFSDVGCASASSTQILRLDKFVFAQEISVRASNTMHTPNVTGFVHNCTTITIIIGLLTFCVRVFYISFGCSFDLVRTFLKK